MKGENADPVKEPPIEFSSLLPFPAEADGAFKLEREDLITCYRVLLSLHQLLSNASALPIPPANRILVGVMRRDLDRALLAIRTIHEMQGTGDEAAKS